jgi:hypothetical protein
MSGQPQQYGPNMPPGMIQPGNIDVYQRPIINNPDGTISTVNSMSFGMGPGREVLIPGVSSTSLLSPEQAWRQYLQTKQHLGIFSTPAAADVYGQWLHHQQEEIYGNRK